MARLFRPTAARKTASVRRPRPPRKPLRMADLPWGKIASVAVVLGAITALIYHQLDIEALHARADEMPAGAAFALLVALPMIGFPASVLHIAAGIRFGAAWGLALVSLSILIHLLASFAIVRVWKKRFEGARWVRKVRERIPEGAHASVCVFTVLLPGAPYAAINYVLPVLGVPLRTLLLCAWPLHTLRSTITVVFGDQSDRLTATRLAVLLVYALMILGASWWTYRRLQRQFANQPSAADGRTPRG